MSKLRATLGLAVLISLAGAAWFGLARREGSRAPAGTVMTAAQPVWSLPEVVNDDGRGVIQFDPAIFVDGDGALHAAWLDFRDGAGTFGLYYARRLAGGAGWQANLRVSDLIGPVCRDDPDVAVDRAGNVHVVWSDYRRVDPDIFMSTLPAGATAWGEPRRVNDDGTTTTQWSPALAADPRGGVFVAWSDYRSGDGAIYVARRAADGTWAPSAPVDANPGGSQDRPAIAVAPSGDVFVAWADQRADAGDIYAARLPPGPPASPGSPAWDAPVRLNRDAGAARQAAPAIGIDHDGAVTVAWHDARDGAGHVWAARVAPEAGGRYPAVWTAEVRLSDSRGADADRPAVGGGPDSATLVAWMEDAGAASRVVAARWLGSRWSAPGRVDDAVVAAGGRNPAVGVDRSGRGHVLWYADDRDRQKDVFHTVADLAAPRGTPVELTGRLIYRVLPGGCPDHGFAVWGCGGEVGAMLEAEDPEALDAWLGRPVRVRGTRVEDGCERIVRVEIALSEPEPCPAADAMVAGRLTAPPVAAPAGAEIRMDDRPAPVGADGRFFLRAVPPGSHRFTARGRCGLTAATEAIAPAGALTRLPPARLRLGDVVPDCAIDARDLAEATRLYGTAPPFDPPCADVNGDGTVGLHDVVSVAASVGATCPTAWSDTMGGAADSAGIVANPFAPSGGHGSIPGAMSAVSESRAQPDPRPRVRLASAEAAPGGLLAAGAVVDAPLTIRGARKVYGFALTVQFDPATSPVVDADPTRPGHQALYPASLPTGAWEIANTVDPARGEAHAAVTLVAPAPALDGDVTLGRMRFRLTGYPGRRPRVTGLALADARGSPIAFDVDVGGWVAATAYHLWVPWVGVDLGSPALAHRIHTKR